MKRINDINITILDLEKYPILAPLFELKTKYAANEQEIKRLSLKIHPGSDKVPAGVLRQVFNDERMKPPADKLKVVMAANSLIEEQDNLVVLRARDVKSANKVISELYEMIASKTDLLKGCDMFETKRENASIENEDMFKETTELVNFEEEKKEKGEDNEA